MAKLLAKIDPELIKKFNITNIQPIKKHNGGINGVGNVSCFGFIGKQKVKIFTTYRADQPELREKLETVQFANGVGFPPLIGTYKWFVVEKWIDGPNLTQIPKPNVLDFVPRMVDFLFEFKKVDIPNYDSSYDHLECFAEAVASRKQHKNFLSLWWDERKKQGDIPKHLRHGDLHEANIVLNDDILYSVDNDGISLDNGWFLAWRKSFLYSTRYPPFPLKDPNRTTELRYYDDKITFQFMQLSHFLRQAFFKRKFIDINNKIVTEKDIMRKFGKGLSS